MKTKCAFCGIEFDKRTSDYNRSEKLGKRHYCSQSCGGKDNICNLQGYIPLSGVYPDNFKFVSFGRADKFTPLKFRTHLKMIRAHIERNRERMSDSNLTLEDLASQWEKQNGICPYTGWKLDVSLMGSRHPKQPSVDRIDSSKGYTPENIQFVALMAQYAKHKFSEEQLIEFCKAVAENHK